MRYLFIVSVLLFLSCKEAPVNEPVNFAEEEVVLDGKRASANLTSYKRTRLPLVEVHYKEAMERDGRLAELDERIDDIAKISIDSLQYFESYQKYNANYYKSASDYLSRIQDTVRRSEISAMLTRSQQVYEQELNKYVGNDQSLRDLQARLADEHMVMKLVVSEAMIRAYQSKKPSLQTFTELQQQYKQLLEESKAYTEM